MAVPLEGPHVTLDTVPESRASPDRLRAVSGGAGPACGARAARARQRSWPARAGRSRRGDLRRPGGAGEPPEGLVDGHGRAGHPHRRHPSGPVHPESAARRRDGRGHRPRSSGAPGLIRLAHPGRVPFEGAGPARPRRDLGAGPGGRGAGVGHAAGTDLSSGGRHGSAPGRCQARPRFRGARGPPVPDVPHVHAHRRPGGQPDHVHDGARQWGGPGAPDRPPPGRASRAGPCRRARQGSRAGAGRGWRRAPAHAGRRRRPHQGLPAPRSVPRRPRRAALEGAGPGGDSEADRHAADHARARCRPRGPRSGRLGTERSQREGTSCST